MSIIERTNPLNLQFRVCVVTAASTPLGVIVCKNLLKANAFVMGVDSRQRDATLNAGLGTHFQFEECDLNDGESPARIIDAAKEVYGIERIDALVNIVEEGRQADLEGLKRLSIAFGEAAEHAETAAVINVLVATEDEVNPRAEPLIEFTKSLASTHREGGMRYNVVVPGAMENDSQHSNRAYEDARTHMTDLIKPKTPENAPPSADKAKLYDIGNVTLFLASDMGREIARSVVYADGSFHAW